MRMKFLSVLFITMLSIGFVSCGDDEDPVMGDKSDLIGKYQGDQKVSITSVSGKTPYEATGNFELQNWIQDNTKLLAYVGNLGSGFFASNFRITDASYTFTLDGTPNTGYEMTQGSGVPTFIIDWFKNDYPDGYSKVVLKLSSTTATFDRKTNKMSFTYTGTIELTPKTTGSNVRTESIKYEFTNLMRK